MPQFLAGPGLGLPFPQNYYPSELQNAAQDPSSNRQTLNQGDTFVIPAGDFYVSLGEYLVLQYLDPVTNIWTFAAGGAFTRGIIHVSSDGYTVRIANLTGCVVAATITAAGSGYVQASTTITAVGGFVAGAAVPTFLPIVGGQLGLTGTFTTDVPTKGAGYGVPRIVMIPPPPPAQNNANGVGGIQASAYAVLGASGSIAAISITNPGAGYPVAPIITVVPSPFDPNLSTGITAATVSFSLTGSGSITGVLCTNSGGPLTNGSLANVTLTLGGAGSAGSLNAVVMQTVVSGTVSGVGVGNQAQLTAGGAPPAGAIATSPDALGLSWIPRQAVITYSAASISAGLVGAITDGGLFLAAPTFLSVPALAGGTLATFANVMGGRPDIAILQLAP